MQNLRKGKSSKRKSKSNFKAAGVGIDQDYIETNYYNLKEATKNLIKEMEYKDGKENINRASAGNNQDC